jgi:hypothetical protein
MSIMDIGLDIISLELEMRLVLPVPVQASPTEQNQKQNILFRMLFSSRRIC